MFRKPMNKRGSEEYNRLFDVRFCPAINNATARGASTQVPDARIAEFQTRGAGGARKVTATIRNTNFWYIFSGMRKISNIKESKDVLVELLYDLELQNEPP
jgi:hypothetical protein